MCCVVLCDIDCVVLRYVVLYCALSVKKDLTTLNVIVFGWDRSFITSYTLGVGGGDKPKYETL